MTSIRLDPDLVDRLKGRADRLGVGWQTLIKMLLKKYWDGEL
jgi:predicted DNA binding CopG/RHH family protein